MRPSKPLLAAVASLAVSSPWAAPASAATMAIVNAHLLTMGEAGDIASGTVVIRDGRITAVGAGVPVPAGAQVFDARGRIVTPGLVATDTTLGVVEVPEGVSSTNDSATGDARLSAAYDVSYALNPDSTLIPEERASGVTRAIVTPDSPGGGEGASRRELIFAGQPAAVHLGAGPDMLVRARLGVVVQLGEDGAKLAGGGRAAAMALLRSALEDARAFARNRGGFERNQTRPFSLSREDLEALVPVAEGRAPLLVRVARAADILQVLRLAREERIRVILEGAEDGWRVAPAIAAAHVPVVLNAESDLPFSFDALSARLDNAARLNTAGVLIAIEPGRSPAFVRSPRFNAGRAVAYGLPYAAALAAVTVNPARIWGLEDRFGSLQVGREGDVVVWGGDPLELTTAPEAVFIKGVAQSLTTRDTRLRDRYLAQDSAPPAPPAR